MKKSITFLITILIVNLIYAQSYDLSDVLKQINGKAFIESGLSGKKVKIGIIDSGFSDTKTWHPTKSVYDNGKIKYIKDFANTDSLDDFENPPQDHGTIVLSRVGGFSEKLNKYYGLATDAEYYLAITEKWFDGKRIDDHEEEIFLGEAIKEFYKLGIRLVNISLGYNDSFKDKKEDYSAKDMDGETAYVTKICNEYANKGMIFIVTAGNEGTFGNSWKTVISPADSKEVISVGATGARLYNQEDKPQSIAKAFYSSYGNQELDFLKPDVVCYSSSGCSFSTPVITGVVACMLQKDSTLLLSQIKSILYKSSTLSEVPNNYVGYGVPDCGKILKIMNNETLDSHTQAVNAAKKYTINESFNDLVVFHKYNDKYVKKQKVIEYKEGKEYKIKRKRNIARTTLVFDNKKVIEIHWK